MILDTLLRKPGGGGADTSTPGAIMTPVSPPVTEPGQTSPPSSDVPYDDQIVREGQNDEPSSPSQSDTIQNAEDDYDIFIPIGSFGSILEYLADKTDIDFRNGIGINYKLVRVDEDILFPIFESMGIPEEDYVNALMIHEPITDFRLDNLLIPVPTTFHILVGGKVVNLLALAPVPGTGDFTKDGEDATIGEMILAVIVYGFIIYKFPSAISLFLRSGLIAAGVRLGTSASNSKYRAAVLAGLATNLAGIDEILDDLSTLATNLFESGITDELSDKDSELIRKLKLWTRTI
jgi:hypothetical protein